MGLLHRIGIALTGLAGWLGFANTPPDDAARAARVTELFAGYRDEFPDVPLIDAAQLQRDLADGVPWVVVDVRTPAERAVSTLPGAIPADAVEQDPAAYAGKRIVAYCTIGYRSGLWAERYRETGLDVVDLEGSILAWTHIGGTLVDPTGASTTRLHVYGRTWDLARTDYQAVW